MATPTPVRIYAGTQEGLFVWRSTNGSWENVSIAFKTGTIDAIDGTRSKPNVVYLGVTQDGLYRTGDAGMSWRRVFEGRATKSPVADAIAAAALQYAAAASLRRLRVTARVRVRLQGRAAFRYAPARRWAPLPSR